MNDTLEDELRSMYQRHGSHLPTHGPGLDHAGAVRVQSLHSPQRHGRRLVLVAAASVALLVGVGGLWAIRRPPIEPAAVDTVPPASTVPAPSTPGRWTLDAPPDGLQLTSVSDQRPPAGSDQFVTRIYASSSLTPELDPFVVLTSYPGEVGSAVIPDSAIDVDVAGVVGKGWSTSGRDVLAVQRAGFWYLLETSGITDAAALATTAERSPDNHGAVIDATLLPSGVTEAGVGAVEEVRFFNTGVLANSIPSVHWETPSRDAGVFYQSIVESPAQFPLHRIEYAYTSITDITVNGHPATTLVGDGFVTVTWNDGQRTVIVTGYNVQADVVINVATSLRPASDYEWLLMENRAHQAQAGAPTATTIGVVETANTDSAGG
jgi:hypothetical protein